ncbi:hypothetical protein EGW08_001366 [Elysia chlorotica]|uniref:Uncharacterized protein n=1 Tax=Elysia chlorotica TaxID=188477 RepID=A0A3S1BT17_ELYCH|nr:hypothetical protein EGW08_001366 [Elysia chlorotica]
MAPLLEQGGKGGEYSRRSVVSQAKPSTTHHPSTVALESTCGVSSFHFLYAVSQNHNVNIMNNGNLPVCPPAPVKRRTKRNPCYRPNLQEEPDMACARCLHYDDQNLSHRPVTEALAPKKKSPQRKLSLRLNQGILPRPFQSRARRNIMTSLRTYRNMVRIFGVEDPALNWINLDTIHRIPLNRAGNLPAPDAPRKPRGESAFRVRELARDNMAPRRLDFDSSDSEEDDDDSGYGGRPWFLVGQ